MKSLIASTCFGALVVAASAQAPIDVNLVGTPANHQLDWTTSLQCNYQVFMSPDLANWIDTGITEPGTGSTITYGLMSTADKLFYRIKEEADPYQGGFLVLPTQDQEVDLIDGVCFAFNLDVFSALPTKIRIYQRDSNSGDPWEQIGQVTDFDEIDGIKFARGSAVWLPDAEGEYEVQAAVVDGAGTVIASAVRRVIVGSNQAPSITITSGPTTPSASAQPAIFTAIATDADGDEVRRVEFYDNGILIGTDTTPYETSPGVFEFGDNIKDFEEYTYDLLKGTHNITAKAFDSRGAVGETASASQYVITGGNARPTIDVTSPASGLIVTQGQSFTIAYTEGDPDGASDIDEVEAYDIVTYWSNVDTSPPFGDLTINTTGWKPGTHTIRVMVRDMYGDVSYPIYLTVSIRAGSGPTFAETLVANIVDETTAAPSNEVFIGVPKSSSEYSGGIDSGLEIDQGIVLTSGSARLWNDGDEWNNHDEGRDEDFGFNYMEAGDPDLEDRVIGVRTTDAAAIEFDVFCHNGQLELDYQFGSEEYDEYVGQFNDGFMVTITPPGATSGTVVSLLPNGSDIVAVNTVSQVATYDQNRHLFLDDDLDIKPSVAPGNEDNQVGYDGMTIRLKAHAFLTSNRVYRVKIVVADTDGNDSLDHFFDSGVFVGKSSLRTLSPTP